MKKGLLITLTGVTLNILETWYFGWNLKPATLAEGYADLFTSLVIILGLILIGSAWQVKLEKDKFYISLKEIKPIIEQMKENTKEWEIIVNEDRKKQLEFQNQEMSRLISKTVMSQILKDTNKS